MLSLHLRRDVQYVVRDIDDRHSTFLGTVELRGDDFVKAYSQGGNSFAVTESFLQFSRHERGICYVRDVEAAISVASRLQGQGIEAVVYDPQLSCSVRNHALNMFSQLTSGVLVTTSGTVLSDRQRGIRFIAHIDLPLSLSAFRKDVENSAPGDQVIKAWTFYGMISAERACLANSSLQQGASAPEGLRELFRFLESLSCRVQTLATLYNRPRPNPCGLCDNCVTPPANVDITSAARLALSCITELSATIVNFGVSARSAIAPAVRAAEVVDILIGQESPTVRGKSLNSWGSGRDLSELQLRFVILRLLSHGLLEASADRMLRLTDKGSGLLAGQGRLVVRSGPTSKPLTWPRRCPRAEALDHWRKSVAAQLNVPAYIVLSDQALESVAKARPSSKSDLAFASGWREKNLDRYSQQVLDVLSTAEEENEFWLGRLQGDGLV